MSFPSSLILKLSILCYQHIVYHAKVNYFDLHWQTFALLYIGSRIFVERIFLAGGAGMGGWGGD